MEGMPPQQKKLLRDRFLAGIIYMAPTSFPSLALCTANDGKLDGTWGTRLVISDSAYELSCAHLPRAARALSQ